MFHSGRDIWFVHVYSKLMPGKNHLGIHEILLYSYLAALDIVVLFLLVFLQLQAPNGIDEVLGSDPPTDYAQLLY